MAERVIRIADLAAALVRAASVPVREGAEVVLLRLDVPMHVRDLPEGDALWSARVHQRARPRFAWLLARFRRARRRRAGWSPGHLQLRWTPTRIDALIDGRRIAFISLSHEGIIR